MRMMPPHLVHVAEHKGQGHGENYPPSMRHPFLGLLLGLRGLGAELRSRWVAVLLGPVGGAVAARMVAAGSLRAG
jgi:hypothetical protein